MSAGRRAILPSLTQLRAWHVLPSCTAVLPHTLRPTPCQAMPRHRHRRTFGTQTTGSTAGPPPPGLEGTGSTAPPPGLEGGSHTVQNTLPQAVHLANTLPPPDLPHTVQVASMNITGHALPPTLGMPGHMLPPMLGMPPDSSYAQAIQLTQWCTRCDVECLHLFAITDGAIDALAGTSTNDSARVSLKVMTRCLYETIVPQELGVFYRWGHKFVDDVVRERPSGTTAHLGIYFRSLAAWKFMRLSGPDKPAFARLLEEHIPMFSEVDGSRLVHAASKAVPEVFARPPRFPQGEAQP